MKTTKVYWIAGLIITLAFCSGTVYAVTGDSSAGYEGHGDDISSNNKKAEMNLPNQLAEMRAQGTRLESALDQNHQGTMIASEKGHGAGGHGHGMMAKDKGMGMMDDAGMGMMKMKSMMSGMGDMKMKKMTMMGMGKMKMKPGGTDSAKTAHPDLPGFPGVLHLYHIGSANHFMDHAERIGLSDEQKAKILEIQESSNRKQAEADNSIKTAEQEMWGLTSSDQPNILEIEKKIREIEKVKADQRIAFIHSVGDAAKILSDEQRKTVVSIIQPEGNEN